MGKRGGLRALPSMVCEDSDSSKIFDCMLCEEKEQMGRAFGKRAEKGLNGYYARHPDEWKELAKTVKALQKEQKS